MGKPRFNVFDLAIKIAIILSAFTDAFRRFSLGPISLQGFITIVAALSCLVLILLQGKITKTIATAPLLVVFIVLGAAGMITYASTVPGLIFAFQNLSVFIAFVGFLILGANESSKSFDFSRTISHVFTQSFKLSALLYAIGIVVDGPGSSFIMGPRSFALFIVIGCAWFLAQYRYRSPGALPWFIFVLLVLALSNSRMVTAISLVLFPLSQASFKRPQDIVRTVSSIFLIVLLAWSAFTFIAPIRERFTSQGDNARIAGIQVNTSGRAEFWVPIITSAMEAPFLGKGPGSVAEIVSEVNDTTNGHPHNDYLRIFHDSGFIGSALWMVGYFGLMGKTFQNWSKADERRQETAPIHLAAFLSLLAFALAMLTDNVIVYIFSMTPLGILVGISLGLRKHEDAQIRAQRLNAYQRYSPSLN